MVPMLTLSWLWHSVEREKTLAGMVCLSASAVQAETPICTALKPWLIICRSSGAPERLLGRPPLNLLSTSWASWRSSRSARLATAVFMLSMAMAM